MRKLGRMLAHDARHPATLAKRLLRKATSPLRLAALPGRIRRAPVLNLHRVDYTNLGDLKCGPYSYFDFLGGHPVVDINDLARWEGPADLGGKLIVVGGGGLLNSVFGRQWELITSDPSACLIVWGGGHNAHGSGRIDGYSHLDRCRLVGLRDYGQGHDWVPCVSCMEPGFDRPHPIRHEVVFFEGSHRPVRGVDPAIPKLTSRCMDLHRVLRFLGSGELVLTSSYHGAYWATLLGKRVVLIGVSSSKFFGMKHPPVHGTPSDWMSGGRSARVYPEALDECRGANRRFAAKVEEYVAAFSTASRAGELRLRYRRPRPC
ncbi:Polysaccharide pyruvyl transferase [Aquisphaera giovannonii]|uniref:Polysaccharide pyruvyl transferase n=1 Tax=Aquisphaera giovannonii TaxID=406548 RepID=A0A5B9VU38_9BACT|nr:polysaccharide pyruvyl transferase family protein [Aquisphaera giovannonii]QEH31748.1 Polysaccharide pyruvyl transferase [Aquisphaera giovannonii]